MNIQLYFLKKNFDTQKAERWFKERRVKLTLVDLARHKLSPRELDSVKAQVGLKAMVDTESKAYLESTARFLMGEGPLKEALLADMRLIKTPIIRNGQKATVGFCPEVWEEWLKAGV